jgi:hypothetical protein
VAKISFCSKDLFRTTKRGTHSGNTVIASRFLKSDQSLGGSGHPNLTEHPLIEPISNYLKIWRFVEYFTDVPYLRRIFDTRLYAN